MSYLATFPSILQIICQIFAVDMGDSLNAQIRVETLNYCEIWPQ